MGIRLSSIVVLGLLAFGLALNVGCATGEKVEATSLSEKVANEPAPQGKAAIAERGAQAFLSSPSLTAEQKEKLLKIHGRVYEQAMAIGTELGKTKSLLFKTVSSADYDSSELRQLRERIVRLDKKRLDLMFAALKDVQEVVGYGKGTEDYYKDYDFSSPRREDLSRRE